MREILINKNLCLQYRLRQYVGKQRARQICRRLESAILFFGRPHYDRTA